MHKLDDYRIEKAFPSLAASCESESNYLFKLLVAVLGGVLAVVIGTAILVQVIVIVICVRKLRRAKGMVSHQKEVNTEYSTKNDLELSGKKYL